MRAPVTVVTATIPGREELLGKCLASVYAQTREVEAHLVMAQSCSEGLTPPIHVAIQQNQLLRAVQTTWTMRLADDDQVLPHHVERLLEVASHADVIYSFDASGDRPRYDCNGHSPKQLQEIFSRTNFIDGSAVLIRTAMLKNVGGWPSGNWVGGDHLAGGHYRDMVANAEDWALFARLAAHKARFVCVPEETWLYGHGDWARSSTGDRAPVSA